MRMLWKKAVRPSPETLPTLLNEKYPEGGDARRWLGERRFGCEFR